MSAEAQARIGELERAVAELRAMLASRASAYDERAAHQAAITDVLNAMAASPGDPQPVFDLMVWQAKSLTDVPGVTIFQYDGKLVHVRATSNDDADPAALAAYWSGWPRVPDRGSLTCQAILDDTIIHVRNMDAEPGVSQVVRDLGHKTQVSVPLMRDGHAIGAITIGSRKVDGISVSQIELLKTFAEQAVIAITSAEAYRALRERTEDLRQSLEYQTATSDVLKVISRSTFDLQPVLDTVAKTAGQLCDAEQSSIARVEEGLMWLAANFGFPSEYEAHVRSRGRMPIDLEAPSVSRRAIQERQPVHIHDAAAVPGYSEVAIRLGKQRTSLGVPLLRDGEVIGVIILARQRVEPFTQRQIDLVSTFADQAVIAIENTRLLSELRESLDQQTATAEVLRVINASPGDLTQVFDAILEKALRICESAFGSLHVYDGEHFRGMATRGMPPSLHDISLAPMRPAPGMGMHRIVAGEDVVHFLDAREDDGYRSGNRFRVALVDLAGARTQLQVALRKDGSLLGVINVYRQEVKPYSEKQIALLRNFAAQAVIAMDNARLLTEQREALEQQTAMAEVLRVINANPGDVTPAFDAMLEKALRLCDAAFGGLYTYDGEAFHPGATSGMPQEVVAIPSIRATPGMTLYPITQGEPVVHKLDLTDDDIYRSGGSPTRQALVDLAGARTQLLVALRAGEVLLGVFMIYRQHVMPFTERQIALVQNFAAQAVIAIENARLLTEQREALERQTATAEVLRVINEHPGDLAPVFGTILEKALTLSEAAFGTLWTFDTESEAGRAAATRNIPPALAEFRANHPPGAPSPLLRRVLNERRTIHQLDIRDDDSYRSGHPAPRSVVELGGARTLLLVPLLKDRTVLGTFQIYRQEVHAFTDRQISLVEDFAAQAVIAMDNARLLNEIRQRQIELDITFENMGDGVAMFDREQKLAAWNRNFQDILDLPDDAVRVGLPFADYIRGLAERGEYGPDASADEQIARLTALLGTANRFERKRPNGRVIDIRQNPISDGGFVIIYADITERKRAEEALRAARDEAEAALRDLKVAQASLIQAEKMASLGQLTAGIAHEIKNPLNFVNNFAALSVELLDELKEVTAPALAALDDDARADAEDLTGTLTSNLHKIEEHGKRADNIVRGMLEHSRGSTGERRSVDLNELVEEALNLAYHGARARDQSFNITLERDYAAGIAPIEVAPQDLTRVFLNLFGNGFDAARTRQKTAPAGFEPKLTVSTRDRGDSVEIRVRDNGTGVPPEIRDKLFQPFFTTKPTGEGTGLGLSISYDIVTQQHGGSIVLDSEPNAFTEFTVTIPRGMTRGQGGTP